MAGPPAETKRYSLFDPTVRQGHDPAGEIEWTFAISKHMYQAGTVILPPLVRAARRPGTSLPPKTSDEEAGTGGDGGPPPSAVPIVIATLLRPVGPTGVQSHFGELDRFLRAQGVPSVVVTPFSAGGFGRNLVFGLRRVVERLDRAMGVQWYVRFHTIYLEWALRQTLARLKDAVVYCQCPASAMAALRARRPGHRVVLAVHFFGSQADEWAMKGEINPGDLAFRSIRDTERQAFAGVDGVVFVSDTARAGLWAELDPVVATATIPNFVRSDLAVEGSAAADLITIGALEPNKNHEFLLEVLAAAVKRGRHYTLDIAGEGPCHRGLERRAASLGLDRQVRFLGHVPSAATTLAGYRAYVHAARRESFGVAILEAMTAGLPVLAPQVGAIPQILDDGVEGRTWELDEPDRAADLLIELLDNEAARERMASAARRRAVSTYSSDVVCPRLYAFLVSSHEDRGAHGARRAAGPTDGRSQEPAPPVLEKALSE